MDLYAFMADGARPASGLLVLSDAPSVAYRHRPAASRPRLRRVGYAPSRPAGPATLLDAVEASRARLAGMASPLDALRHDGVRSLLRGWGCDGFKAPVGDGHAIVVTWEPERVDALPEPDAGPGRVTVAPGALRIDLTTAGRQLALDLHREGLGVGVAGAARDPRADALETARRHVASWLLASCTAPDGTSLSTDGDDALATSGGMTARYSTSGIEPEEVADRGWAVLPALSQARP